MKRLVVSLAALSLLVFAEASASAQITQEKGTKTQQNSAPAPEFRVTNEPNGNYAVEFEKEAIDVNFAIHFPFGRKSSPQA